MTEAIKEYTYVANPYYPSLILDINKNYAPFGWSLVNIIIVDSGYYFAALERNKDGE